jgi:hypothetical protein
MLKKISTNNLKETIDTAQIIKNQLIKELHYLEIPNFKLSNLKRDIITIKVNEGNLASEIILRKPQIIKNINKYLIKKIKDIKVKISNI